MTPRQKFMLSYIKRKGTAIVLDFREILPEFTYLDLRLDLDHLSDLGLIERLPRKNRRCRYNKI